MNLSKKKTCTKNISIIRFEKANIFEALSAFMQGTEIFFFINKYKPIYFNKKLIFDYFLSEAKINYFTIAYKKLDSMVI